MARGVHARRYSQAIFEIALDKQELDRWRSDLDQIVHLYDDAGLINFLESPKFDFDDKARLLAERLGGLNPLALNLVYLLVTRGRLSMVREIAGDYQRRLDSYRGIEPADVTTAIPLDDEDKQRLAQHLGAAIGKKVVLKAEVDSGLISGVIARVGGKLLDGSTRSKLEALRREMARAGR